MQEKNNVLLQEKSKNVAFYTHEEIITDQMTGEILSSIQRTVAKVSTEPDYIKVYYATMLAFKQINNVPVSFLLSLSKHIEWTNDGKPMYITLNRRIKTEISNDCTLKSAQIDRYIRKSVENGLLFKTEYRGVYEVNPFMIAKGRWDSIKKLQTNFDYVNGKWERATEYDRNKEEENND